MQTTGKLKDVFRQIETGKIIVSFVVDANEIDIPAGLLDIKVEPHRAKRSLNANGLLWKCISDISKAIGADKWKIYLSLLRRYGEYTYVCVKPQAVEMVKRQWRECEEIGTIKINGADAVQMLCYYGSSTYDTKQFSVLLDGTISEMKEMGLEPPTDEQMRHSLEAWEKMTAWNTGQKPV